jgi:hypothetical protein
MGRFLTEHRFKIAGALSREESISISRMFVRAADEVGPGFRWIRAYVTEVGVLSDCIANDGAQAREHAEKVASGDLVNVIEVVAVIDPDTAKQSVEEEHE